MNLKFPMMIAVGLIALMLLAAAVATPQLNGAPVAMHWGLDGEPNGWVSPSWAALLITPGIALLVSSVMLFQARFTPARAGPQRSPAAFRAVFVGVLVLLTAMQGLIIAEAMGFSAPMQRVTPAAVGALFLVIGNVAGKIRHNFVLGLRTPWTLASERVWDKTHRLYGWLTVAAGLVLIAAAALVQPASWLVAVTVAGALVPMIVAVLYAMALSAREGSQA